MTLATILTPAPTEKNDIGWRRLLEWQRTGASLAFVYSRSLRGLMQTGQCRIALLTPEAATLDAGASKLLVALAGSVADVAPQLFFTPDLQSHYGVEGVALQLANHDWLFFSGQPIPEDFRLDRSA